MKMNIFRGHNGKWYINCGTHAQGPYKSRDEAKKQMYSLAYGSPQKLAEGDDIPPEAPRQLDLFAMKGTPKGELTVFTAGKGRIK